MAKEKRSAKKKRPGTLWGNRSSRLTQQSLDLRGCAGRLLVERPLEIQVLWSHIPNVETVS